MDDTPWWISLLVSWLPFIALIAVWIYLSKGFQGRSPSGRTLIQLYEDQLAETKKMNTILERVAAALERRAEK